MIIKNMKKNIPQDRISNNYWIKTLQANIEFGDNYDTEYENAVNTITPGDVVEMLKKLVEQKNFIQVTLGPVK